MPRRPPDPAIPGTPRDRTGATPILRRALREVDRRWAGLQREVLALVDAIPRITLNDAAAPVLWQLTPEQMAQLSAALQEAVARWIASDRDPAAGAWSSAYLSDAAQLGTAQSVANLSALSETYAAARSIETVIYSEPYRNRLAMAMTKSYAHWSGVAAEVRGELAQIIGRAVVDGRNPRAVRSEIVERLGVSASRAASFAQTDITDTLRQARWAEAEHAREHLGIRTALLWTSALIPTTRPWHASRSGRVYEVAEVRAFYQQRGEIFRCHCSQTEVLLDADGAPILTDRLKAAMRAERAAWQREHRA